MLSVQCQKRRVVRVRNIKTEDSLRTETTKASTVSNTVLFQLALKNGLVRFKSLNLHCRDVFKMIHRQSKQFTKTTQLVRDD